MCNFKDTVEYCSATSCPFAYTEESEIVQNYGCLPTPYEILLMKIQSDKTWACHTDNSKPCLGGIKRLKEYGLDYKVTDKVLVTENEDWSIYIKDITEEIK